MRFDLFFWRELKNKKYIPWVSLDRPGKIMVTGSIKKCLHFTYVNSDFESFLTGAMRILLISVKMIHLLQVVEKLVEVD